MAKSGRRKFTRQFKVEAVKLITEQGYSTSQAARSLDIGANILRRWNRDLEAKAAGTRLGPEDHEELLRLRCQQQLSLSLFQQNNLPPEMSKRIPFS